jgi:galactonate dehydratase
MKITAITPYVVGHWVLVDVETDEGIRGAGEATYFVNPLAGAQVVRDLTPSLVGEDPFRAEWHQHRLTKAHCLRDAALSAALSAIDQALWDIKGRALGVPVWQLLGGRVRDRVRAILLVEAVDLDSLLAESRRAVAEGFTALKIKPFLPGWSLRSTAAALREASDVVAAVRATIGWDVDLAVEAHRNLVPGDAVTFARSVEDQGLVFLEDSIVPFGVDANRAVAARIGPPVATAERCLNIWEFREYSDSHDIAFLRPDIGLVGGFSQMRKVAAIAESRHQRIVPHNFTSPVVTACHVQMAACTPNWDLQGYVREDRSPWNQVTSHVNVLRDGFIEIPETPGIGLELDLEFLRGATYEPFGNRFLHSTAVGPDGGIRIQ